MLERDQPTARIVDALDSAGRGTGEAVVIEGSAGIGKSALLEAAKRAGVDHGFVVLSARGIELEVAFPYGVVRQLMQPALASAGREDSSGLFEGAAARAAQLLTAVAGPELEEGTGTAEILIHALWWLTVSLAQEAPLLIAVDDAQWADEPSLRYLSHLRYRIHSLPAVVLLSVRTGEPISEPLKDLLSDPAVDKLRLENLSEEASHELMRSRLGNVEETFCRRCFRATRGNPFLLNELLLATQEGRLGPDIGTADVDTLEPPNVGRAVARRLERTGPTGTALARAIALWGGKAELRQAARVAGIDSEDAGVLADRLSAMEILAPERPLDFVHPLIRAAVYRQIPPSGRTRGHREVARLLQEDGAPVEHVAAHLLLTEPAGQPSTVQTLREGARVALARGAPESAKRYLDRAIREPPPKAEVGAVMAELGVAELRIDPHAAIHHLSEAMAATSSPDLRAELALHLIRAHLVNGTVQEAEVVARPLIAELEKGRRELAMRVEAELFIALRQGMAVSPVADASLDRWTDGLSGDSPSERLLLSQMAVRAALTAAGAGEVAALAGAALGGGKLLDDVSSDSVLAFVPLYPLLCADRIQLVSDYLDKAFEDARRRGSPIGFAYALTFRAHLELVTGEIRAAESDAAQAFEIFESFRQPFNLPGGADALLGALIEADRAHEGEELIRRLRLDGSVPDTVPGRVFLASRGRLRLEKGRVEEALADYLDLLGREREKGRSNLHLTPHVQWAAVSLYLAGRREEALDLAREGLRVARHWGPGRLLALNLTLAARTLGGEEGFELLSEAVAVAEQSPSRLALAYALAEKGAARGDPGAGWRPSTTFGPPSTTLTGAGPQPLRSAPERTSFSLERDPGDSPSGESTL